MKTRQSGFAAFANALATAFTLFPNSDYQAAFPRRSAQARMNAAWGRTARDMRQATDNVTRKHGISR